MLDCFERPKRYSFNMFFVQGKASFKLFLLVLLDFCFFNLFAFAQEVKKIDLVDPFWGCDGGNVFVGACSPLGMVRLGPDCVFPTPTSGYVSSKPIIGFSHTHLSGTGGGGRYGNILVTPQLGKPDWKRQITAEKQNERAKPGYYAVDLLQPNGVSISSELAALQNVGKHKYAIQDKNRAPVFVSFLIDFSHTISRKPKESFKGCRFLAQSDGTFQGSASFAGGWGGDNPYTIFFHGLINLKNPTLSYKIDTLSIPEPKGSKKKPTLKFDTLGVAYSGYLAADEWVDITLSISFKGWAEAQNGFAQMANLSFEALRKKAENAWEDHLSAVELEGSPEELKLAYSALYHTLIMPTDVSGHHPEDQNGESHFWEHYTLWDTFRCLMPLHNLLYPAQQKRMFQSLIRIGERKGWLPDAWIAGWFAQAQGGCNAEVVLAEAVQKGLISGSEAQKAWQVCYDNATRTPDHPEWYGRHPEYLQNGFCSAKVKNCTSHSLEWAYNDFAMAKMAAFLEKTDAEKFFRDRSARVLNLWYPERRFFWAKDSSQQWMSGFTPDFMRPDHWNGPYFYEGNSWLYHLSAFHLTDSIINRMGGAEKLVQRLDTTFLLNKFDMGNEPGFLLPFGYFAAGRADKGVEAVHKLAKEKFVSGRKGLPGQDDSGALSSWYFWANIGLYPLAGTTTYFIFPPILKKTELMLGGGKTLVVKGTGAKPYWNGKPIKTNQIDHRELVNGGVLEWKSK